MLCPSCRAENVAGADACAECGSDLTAFDTPGARDELESLLTERSIETLAPAEPIFVPSDATVAQAVERLRERHIGAVLVGTPEAPAGIFSERDLLLRVAHRWEAARERPVADFMTRDLETLEAEAPIVFALNRMEVGDYRHVPVTRGGRVVGMISIRDVVELLAKRHADLIPPLAGS